MNYTRKKILFILISFFLLNGCANKQLENNINNKNNLNISNLILAKINFSNGKKYDMEIKEYNLKNKLVFFSNVINDTFLCNKNYNLKLYINNKYFKTVKCKKNIILKN